MSARGATAPRATSAIALAIVGLACVATACIDIDGTDEGSPCNPQGQCVPGLICVQGVCRGQGAAGTWKLLDNTPTTAPLKDVWGASASAVYAVGEKIIRYDGALWHTVHEGSDESFEAIWGASSTVIWAAGKNIIYRSDGASWALEPVEDVMGEAVESFTVYAIHGDSTSGSYFAAASFGSSLKVLLKYLGGRWREQPAKLTGMSSVRGLRVIGDKVYVVGSASFIAEVDANSGQVTQLALPGTSSIHVRDIWGNTRDGLLAVGESEVLAFDGQRWIGSEELGMANSGRAAHGIWGKGDSQFYVVGASSKSPVEFCGVGCVKEDVPEAAKGKTLYGIWGDGTSYFAVGSSGIAVGLLP